MKSVYRWISEHKGLCKAGLFLGLTVFTFYAASFEYVSFLSVYLVDLLIWFIATRFISTASGKLLLEPLEILNQQCDPYPFLEETERQLGHRESGPQQQLNEINYATALRMVGQNQRVVEILEKINIDRYPGTTPYIKFIYYNNLADALFALDRTTEALIWHRKAVQIFDDLPENKVKQQYAPTMQLSQAEAMYYQQDYDKALRKVAWINCQSRRTLLDAALLAAKCHIALEEPEKAREKLRYVADNGNKLHIVEEAKTLLEALN